VRGMRQSVLALTVCLVAALSFVSPSSAGMCADRSPFLSNARIADLVVLAEVVRHEKVAVDRHSTWMDIKIIKILAGVEKKKTIRVHAYNQMFGIPAESFKKGKSYVFAFGPYARRYELGSCGDYYLEVDGQVAFIGDFRISLADLARELCR